MCDCCQSGQSASAVYFDSIASKWDSWEDLESLNKKFDAALKGFGMGPGENVLDVGCGTGNLTAAILRQLSGAGRITAVDLSERMLEIAHVKVNDSRVRWLCGAVEDLDSPDGSFDRIICYSVWPHLTEPLVAAQLFHRMLKPGGRLHIWHLKSREAVNKIHAEASDAVHDHLLAPAPETAALLKQSGFVIEEMQDDDDGYLVTAQKARS